MNDGEFQGHTQRIEQLVERAAAVADESARSTALELLQSVMDLHGAVMSRVVEILSDSGEAGRNSLTKLGSDPLVCGLLVLYGIHPVALEDRITQAVVKVRPQLGKLGGTVELLGIADSVVRIKIGSAGHSCGSSADALSKLVKGAILEAAPEVLEVVVEGTTSSASGFVPLDLLQPATIEEGNYEKSTA